MSSCSSHSVFGLCWLGVAFSASLFGAEQIRGVCEVRAKVLRRQQSRALLLPPLGSGAEPDFAYTLLNETAAPSTSTTYWLSPPRCGWHEPNRQPRLAGCHQREPASAPSMAMCFQSVVIPENRAVRRAQRRQIDAGPCPGCPQQSAQRPSISSQPVHRGAV